MAKLNWLCFASLLAIAVPAAAQRAPLFESEILPVLEKNCVSCHSDIHATVHQLLGIDYKKNTFPYEGREESPAGVNPARVINELLVS
jgi:hypothetical protein